MINVNWFKTFWVNSVYVSLTFALNSLFAAQVFAFYLDPAQNVVLNGQQLKPSDQITRMSVAIVLKMQPSDGKEKICSGTLIAKDLILTAAHCLNNLEDNSVAESVYITRFVGGDESKGVFATEWKIHPQFKLASDTSLNSGNTIMRYVKDLALIKLENAEDLTVNTLAVELPDLALQTKQNLKLAIAGFGATVASSPDVNGVLHFAWSNGYQVNVDGNADTQIELTGTQNCHGDSGGSTLLPKENNFVLVGVTSSTENGVTCEIGSRSISVYPNLDWIRSAAKELRSSLTL